MIKNDSYIVIPGWVVNKYNLKGNSLIVYSIIYGFCQDRESCFHGSLNYLAEWTQSTKQSIIGVLKELIEIGLIRKEESFPNNKYYVVFDEPEEVKETLAEGKESLPSGKDTLPNGKESLTRGKESLPNNINNNINNIINNTKYNNTNPPKGVLVNSKHIDRYAINKETNKIIQNVVDYLNLICGTTYRATTGSTQKFIKARLKEGFTEEDFKKVIDIKYMDWGVTPRKFSNGQMSNIYLRPQTLFGTNMESYLQQANVCSKEQVRSVPVDETKLSDMVF